MRNEHLQSGFAVRGGDMAVAPPTWVEAGYYAVTLYAIMCQAWHIAVQFLGALGLAVLAAYCVLHLGTRAPAARRAVVVPLFCALSFLAVQIGFHEESIMGAGRPFITWMLSVVVVQTLLLRRGFIYRFALFAFVLILAVLPYLQFRGNGPGVFRAGLQKDIGVSNPNELAAWLGFCAVFFTILGLETGRQAVRFVSAAIGTACLLLVALTVSRGTLMSVAIAIVIAFRRTLKKGFFPLLVFVAAVWTAFGLGLFDQAIGGYAARGTEETGRLVAWPWMFKRFLDSPLIGVGASHVETWVPKEQETISPHNSFMFFSLSSGIVPVLIFIVYWLRAGWNTIAPESDGEASADQPFRLPLFVFLLLVSMATDFAFMTSWGVVTLSLAMSVGVSRRAMRARPADHFQPSRRQPGPRYKSAYVLERGRDAG